MHSPDHGYAISPKKLPRAPTDSVDEPLQAAQSERRNAESSYRQLTPDLSSIPPAPAEPRTPTRSEQQNYDASTVPSFPPTFTPSINRTLNKVLPTEYKAPSLPEGMTVSDLKTRLNGKKKIKYVDLYSALTNIHSQNQGCVPHPTRDGNVDSELEAISLSR